jgi:DNA repair and recombination protein RAD52
LSAFDQGISEALDAPLDPQRVSKRSGGGGKEFSYLEGWDVKQRANEIFGYGGWGYRVADLSCLGEEEFTNSNGKTGVRVGYRAIVEVSVGPYPLDGSIFRDTRGYATYSDVGYGDAQEYNMSRITPHELASKEAVTDALKRAFASLGDQFGLCLYDKEAPEHDGRNADPLADLKARVTQLAIDGGVEADPQAIADAYSVTLDDLKTGDEEFFRGLLAAGLS